MATPSSDSPGDTLAQRRDAAERIGGALAEVGMVRLPARLFAALLVDDDGRMTAAEVATFLQVSPASVSGAVRYLTTTGLVRREREPGSRRDVYVVDDAWHHAMMQHDRLYGPIKQAMSASVTGLGDTPGAARIQLAQEFLEFLSAELDGISERWLAHRHRLDQP